MAQAKNRNKKRVAKALAVIPVEQRIKNFEADIIKAVQTHQVGIRPYNDKYGPKIEYVDLVEAAKQNAAQA